MRTWITVLSTVGALVVYLLLYWLLGPRVPAFVWLALIFGAAFYSARYGRLARALPGLRVIDYLAVILIAVQFGLLVAFTGTPLELPIVLILAGSLLVWGFFCLFRFQSIKAGASLSLSEALWGDGDADAHR